MTFKYDNHQDLITSRSSWRGQEKAHTIDAKVMNALYCELDEVEFNRVFLAELHKEIWDFL